MYYKRIMHEKWPPTQALTLQCNCTKLGGLGQRRVRKKSLDAFKSKVREKTRRTWGIRIE